MWGEISKSRPNFLFQLTKAPPKLNFSFQMCVERFKGPRPVWMKSIFVDRVKFYCDPIPLFGREIQTTPMQRKWAIVNTIMHPPTTNAYTRTIPLLYNPLPIKKLGATLRLVWTLLSPHNGNYPFISVTLLGHFKGTKSYLNLYARHCFCPSRIRNSTSCV
jgi:hypothetical protein